MRSSRHWRTLHRRRQYAHSRYSLQQAVYSYAHGIEYIVGHEPTALLLRYAIHAIFATHGIARELLASSCRRPGLHPADDKCKPGHGCDHGVWYISSSQAHFHHGAKFDIYGRAIAPLRCEKVVFHKGMLDAIFVCIQDGV